jgi:hypothetical protein
MRKHWWWGLGGVAVGLLVAPKVRAWLPFSLPGRG